jgi:hypothetical protein
MVVLALVAPALVGAALYALANLLGFDLLALVASSPWSYGCLILVALAAVLAAAYRRRDNVVLLSAWLFLFCGMTLVSLGQFVDIYAEAREGWSSEILEDAAFVPLLIFTLYISAPVRLLLLPQRKKLLFWILGAGLFAAVAAVVLVPWLGAAGGAQRGEAEHLLILAQPLLDVLLLVPVGLFVISLGWLHGREPYPLIGLGLLLTVPGDILEHYHLLSHRALQGQLAFLFALASQLYFLMGALLCATCRKRTAEGSERALP